jgi:multidrug efflux system membrane fusion protein
MRLYNIKLNNLKTVIKIITLSYLLLFLVACCEEKAEEKKLIRPVKYHQVGFSGGDKVRVFSGTSKTDQVVKLSFRSTGVLTELNIKLGQTVSKGDLLAKLDNVQARLSYENSISSKNSSESKMNTTKLNLNRIKALYEKGGSSLSDLEAAKDAARNAQQNYNSALRNVDIQQEQINYGYLYASTDGEISDVNVELNENISTGQVIATLNSGSHMNIALGLPESVINNIKLNMPVQVTFTSLNDKSFKGRVSEVSPSLDANTATYPITIDIEDSSSEIKSGMAANVTFNFKDAGANNDTVLVVPANAVGENSKGRFVFVLNPNGETAIANKQTIQIGKLTSEGFEIISGLKSGQLIATAGLQTLLEGQEVSINKVKMP